MHLLGLNLAYHESSACLLSDGDLVAVEEERLTRLKHAKDPLVNNADQVPTRAIDACLEIAGLTPDQVDEVGVAFDPPLRPANADLNEPTVEGDWGSATGERRFQKSLANVPARLREYGIEANLRWLSHHRCHAASAYYPSPFDEAAVLTMDGIGEVSSTTFGRGGPDGLVDLAQWRYPASIGFVWEKLARYLGFGEHDAAKVMGLAANGDPQRFATETETLLRPDDEAGYLVGAASLRFRVPDYGPLEALFGLPRRQPDQPLGTGYEDVAAALQSATNEVVLALAHRLHNMAPLRAVCLAGGVALNCVANAALIEDGPFDEVWIQPAANDAGTALGAAYLLLEEYTHDRSVFPRLSHVYLGPSYDDREIRRALLAAGLPPSPVDDIDRRVARCLSTGATVGWFQGALEFGPRALGNRSLLADPRDPKVREHLNEKIKRRETFRPFAPSVLAEEADRWFHLPPAQLPARYMLMAVAAKEQTKLRAPAVVHVDGTSRVQIVDQATNPSYHAVLSEFARLTGVPMLLNTSFNDQEPIVCTPSDAIRTSIRAGIDFLAIGNHLIQTGA